MNQQLADVSGVMREAVATGLFISLCTIQTRPTTLGITGRPVDTGLWSNVSGLVSIRCMSAPPNVGTMSEQEQKLVSNNPTLQFRHVLLDSYYPSVQRKQRAAIDGEDWDIVAVDSDSQNQMTRLLVQEYTA